MTEVTLTNKTLNLSAAAKIAKVGDAVDRLHFTLPKIYDGRDLTIAHWKLVYQLPDASGAMPDLDITVTETAIVATYELKGSIVSKAGKVDILLTAVDSENEIVFQSDVASITVAKTLIPSNLAPEVTLWQEYLILYDTRLAGAQSAQAAAEAAAVLSAASASDAQTARTGAETAKGLSEAARDAAVVAKNAAEALYGDLTAVEAAKIAAQQAKTDAETAKGLAETAKGASEAARDLAGGYASSASEDAGLANGSAVYAGEAANAAIAAKGLAEGARDAALGHAGTAGSAKDAAVVAQGLAAEAKDAAVVAKGLSEEAKDASVTAKGLSETAKTAAEAARDKAQKWAEETEDTPVEEGKYSAKHHAAKAQASAEAAAATLASKANQADLTALEGVVTKNQMQSVLKDSQQDAQLAILQKQSEISAQALFATAITRYAPVYKLGVDEAGSVVAIPVAGVVELVMKGRRGTNLVPAMVDANADGLADGWGQSTTTGRSFLNGEQTFTASAQYGYVYMNIPVVAGQSFFIHAFISCDTSSSTDIQLQLVNMATPPYNSIGAYLTSDNAYQQVAVSGSLTDTTTYILRIIDRRASGWTPIKFKLVMAINLTNSSEASLSTAQCVERYGKYFNGTASCGPMRYRLVGENQFDKTKTALQIQPLYPSAGGGTILSSANVLTILHQCLPSTVYTVSKQSGNRLRLATISSYPAVDMPILNQVNNDAAGERSATITTHANARYLAIMLNDGADIAGLYALIIAGVQIEYGSVATAYKSFQQSFIADPYVKRSVPAIADRFYRSGGQWWHEKNVEKGALGSEKLTNGDFASYSAPNWASWSRLGVGAAGIVAGEGNKPRWFIEGGGNDAYLSQQNATTVGKLYKTVISVTVVSGKLLVNNKFDMQLGATGTYVYYFIANSTSFFLDDDQSALRDITLNSVSVKEIVTTGGTPRAIASQTQVSDDGTTGFYQLNIPILTPVPGGDVLGFANSTAFVEAWDEEVVECTVDGQITCSYKPATIESLKAYDGGYEWDVVADSISGNVVYISEAVVGYVYKIAHYYSDETMIAQTEVKPATKNLVTKITALEAKVGAAVPNATSETALAQLNALLASLRTAGLLAV